jgi:CheY-like chemotaxis protein
MCHAGNSAAAVRVGIYHPLPCGAADRKSWQRLHCCPELMWCKMRGVKPDVSSDPAGSAAAGAAPAPHSSLMRDLAHELRDALSPVASSLDLLRLQNFDPQASRSAAERIDRGLRRALLLLDTFALADECERGTLPLQLQSCRLSELLQAASATVTATLAARCAGSPGAAVEVLADRDRSVRLLASLLQHADELAAPDGPITVQVQAHAPVLAVRFSAVARERVGEHCFDSWRTPSATVMALRTARRLMLLQGGSLQLRPVSADEFEFIATFAPSVAGAVAPAPEAGSPDHGPRERVSAPAGTVTRVLIVDDSAEVRKAYSEALVALGYSVTEAVNAEEALRIIESDAPHVALIDIHLPQMNGYRLAQTVKARVGSTVRLIMLSGMTMDVLTQRMSRQAGFDACLDKMAGPAALHRLLQSPDDDSSA